MLKYTHTRLLVRDFPAAFQFYRDTLGFATTFGAEDENYADFETGGVALALFPRGLMAEAVGTMNTPAGGGGQDPVALIFAVEDVDQAYRDLGARGVDFVTPPQDRPLWGIRTAHFRDPDGNLLEIYSPLG